MQQISMLESSGQNGLGCICQQFLNFTMQISKFTASNNQFHNVLRLFDLLPNFLFTTSETMDDYYLQTWYIRVTSPVAERRKTLDLRKLVNIRKLLNCLNFIERQPSLPAKMKFFSILAENPWKIKIKLISLCAISHENQSQFQIFCELLSMETFF